MYGKKHSDKSKMLMSKVKRKMNKLHPKPKKVRVVMSKSELSFYRHTYMKALWRDENIRKDKIEGLRKGNMKRRLFGDDVVNTLRQEYLEYKSFIKVSELHSDITYNQIRNLIKFGTTHNSPNSSDNNWLNTIN